MCQHETPAKDQKMSMSTEAPKSEAKSSNATPAKPPKPAKSKTSGLTLLAALAVMTGDTIYARRAGWERKTMNIRKRGDGFVTLSGDGYNLGIGDITASDWYIVTAKKAENLKPGEMFISDNRQFIVLEGGKVRELSNAYNVKDFGSRDVLINEDSKAAK